MIGQMSQFERPFAEAAVTENHREIVLRELVTKLRREGQARENEPPIQLRLVRFLDSNPILISSASQDVHSFRHSIHHSRRSFYQACDSFSSRYQEGRSTLESEFNPSLSSTPPSSLPSSSLLLPPKSSLTAR